MVLTIWHVFSTIDYFIFSRFFFLLVLIPMFLSGDMENRLVLFYFGYFYVNHFIVIFEHERKYSIFDTSSQTFHEPEQIVFFSFISRWQHWIFARRSAEKNHYHFTIRYFSSFEPTSCGLPTIIGLSIVAILFGSVLHGNLVLILKAFQTCSSEFENLYVLVRSYILRKNVSQKNQILLLLPI